MTEVDDANPLLVEIMAERASAYFATTRKMEKALRALSEFDRTFTSRTALDDKQRRHREELLAEAAEQAWIFVIQREAMKFSFYEELFSDFGISDEVRKRMGPRDLTFKS